MLARQPQTTEIQSQTLAMQTLYDRLGGRDCLALVHKRLYDKIFNHPVLGVFFAGKNRQHQEDQQSDYMADQFGGPRIYGGRVPRDAHQHLFITEEHFELRATLLEETLVECGVAAEAREQWMTIDRGFKRHIVKKSIHECEKRYKNDEIISAP
jgi:hemoglobin